MIRLKKDTIQEVVKSNTNVEMLKVFMQTTNSLQKCECALNQPGKMIRMLKCAPNLKA